MQDPVKYIKLPENVPPHKITEMGELLYKFGKVCEKHRDKGFTVRGIASYEVDSDVQLGYNSHSDTVFLWGEYLCMHGGHVLLNDKGKIAVVGYCCNCGHEDWIGDMGFRKRDDYQYCVNCRNTR